MNNVQQASTRRKSKSLRHGKKKPLSKKAKIWITVGIIFGILLSLIVAGVIFVSSYFDYNYDPITKDPEQLGVVEPPKEAKEITNIALFGIDSRDDDYKGLSDVIMVISINPNTGSIKLVSIVRDTLVAVDGHGYQKINAAYSKGGPELAIKTLNQTFRLNIMDYATVDFVGMAEIVDAVGGVEVELTTAEIAQVNGCIDELANKRGLPRDYVSKAGVQTLNGVQAVAFSRVRKVPTVAGTRDDYGRTERQRLVMNQLFQKALTLPFAQYPALIKTVLPYIQTSMGFDDILSLSGILKADSVSMQQNRIPIDQAIISSGYSVPYIGSCVYYDLDYAADLLNAFFFKDITFDEYVAENGVRKNLWYTGPKGSASSSSASSDKTSSSSSSVSDSSVSETVTDTNDTGTVSDTASESDNTSDTGTNSQEISTGSTDGGATSDGTASE